MKKDEDVYSAAKKRAALGIASFALAFAAFFLIFASWISLLLRDGFLDNWSAVIVALFIVFSIGGSWCVVKYKTELDKSLCLVEGLEFADRDGIFPYVQHVVGKRETPDENLDYPKIIATMLYFKEEGEDGYRRDLALSSFFLTALVSPQAVFTGITDDIAPRSRSLFVMSEIDIRIPYNLRTSSFVVPVLMQERAGLPDDLRVEGSSDAIVSTLNLQETIDYLMRVLETCFPFLKGDQKVCKKLRRYISGVNDYGGEEIGEQRAKDAVALFEEYCTLLKDESNKKGIEERDLEPIKQLFLGVLDALLYAYPICARVCSRIGAMERDSTTLDGLCYDSSIKRNAQLIVSRSYPLIKEEPRFVECEKLNSALNRLCRRPMTLYYDLGNADRAQSYHFRAKGPEGTYFRFAGMKRFPKREGNALEADMAFLQRRHGQRHARFAVKDGFGFSDWSFMFGYDERSFTIFHMILVVSLIPVLLFVLFLPEIICPSCPDDISTMATFAGGLTVVASLAGAWIIDRRGAGQVYPMRPWLLLFSVGVAVVAIFVCVVTLGSGSEGAMSYPIALFLAILCALFATAAAIILINRDVHALLGKRPAGAIQGSLVRREGGKEASSKLLTTWSPGWHASSYHRISVPDSVKKDIAKGVGNRRAQYNANPNYVRDSILYGAILLENASAKLPAASLTRRPANSSSRRPGRSSLARLPRNAVGVLQTALCKTFELSIDCAHRDGAGCERDCPLPVYLAEGRSSSCPVCALSEKTDSYFVV